MSKGVYPVFRASFLSRGECVRDSRLDGLSLGAPLSLSGPNGLFDFLPVAAQLLFCSWNSQRGKKKKNTWCNQVKETKLV